MSITRVVVRRRVADSMRQFRSIAMSSSGEQQERADRRELCAAEGEARADRSSQPFRPGLSGWSPRSLSTVSPSGRAGMQSLGAEIVAPATATPNGQRLVLGFE